MLGCAAPSRLPAWSRSPTRKKAEFPRSRRIQRPLQHPDAVVGGDGQDQGQEGPPKIIDHIHRPAVRQHTDEVHGPDAATDRDGGTGKPQADGAAKSSNSRANTRPIPLPGITVSPPHGFPITVERCGTRPALDTPGVSF